MSNLLNTSKRFLEWAQSLPNVVVPAGLESDVQEAITEAEAAQHRMQSDGATWRCTKCGHENLNTLVACIACGSPRR